MSANHNLDGKSFFFTFVVYDLCKGTNLSANHNTLFELSDSNRLSMTYAKVLICQQITTGDGYCLVGGELSMTYAKVLICQQITTYWHIACNWSQLSIIYAEIPSPILRVVLDVAFP